ncbi:hypothetical protein SD71_10615 [Cohnella kolymensis]|uniref:Putative exodeoxyribonuclease 8 PDDEXK-like domain-containing protein n=1 Tax=Cohnella kolymensis TaxID=1590652 RepID=A0ABR5A4I2_9BACL|nr:PD-(D/E)XK nuclease-like domain-containing protein [Cohnella kolymensis]KIL35842.1 hypothetical protein SD71_10615 [Cohnella kolymensis]
MKLTNENYFSAEADRFYMSNSQYKGFLACEAQALAKLNGEYTEPQHDALLLGSYVHAAIESVTAQIDFIEKHPQMFSSRGATKGELKAEYRHADKMISTVLEDPLCAQMLEGEKEVIITAELFGVPWKAKIDVLAEDRIVDLKTVKSIRERYWHNGAYVSFVEAYGYLTQMSVYQQLVRLHKGEALEPYIVAVSKEDEPDKAVIMFDESTLERELNLVSVNLPHIVRVKQGLEEPRRCEKCRYCRSTKKAEIVHFASLLEGA